MDIKSTKSKKILNLDWKWWLTFIVAFATLIAAVYIPLTQNKKNLEIFATSKTPLVKIDEKYKSRLEVIYDGEKIEEAVVSVFQVYNSGNQPIEPEDFQRPLSFNFDKEAQILDAKVIDTRPNNINVQLSIKDSKVILDNTLINPKDSINISFITTTTENPQIDVRISKVSNVEIQEKEARRIWYHFLSPVAAAFMLIGVAICSIISRIFGSTNKSIAISVLVCFAVVIFASYIA